MKQKIFIYLILLLILNTVSLSAIDLPSKLGFSIGNPFLGLTFKFTPKIKAEIRSGFDSEVKVFGARGYYNLFINETNDIFTGLEINQINFNYEDISGDGISITPIVGTELLLNKQVSLILDIGYAYVTLRSQDFSVNGQEWMFNVGLNFYFSFS